MLKMKLLKQPRSALYGNYHKNAF